MYVNYEKIERPATFGDLRALIQANDTPFQVADGLLEDPASWAYYDAYLSRQGRPVAVCPPEECLFPCFVRGQAIVDVPEARHVAYRVLSEAVTQSNYPLHVEESLRACEALLGRERRAGRLTGWRGGLISSLMWLVEGSRDAKPHVRVYHSSEVTRNLAVSVLRLKYKVGARALEEAGEQFVLGLLTGVGPHELRRAFQEAANKAREPRIYAS